MTEMTLEQSRVGIWYRREQALKLVYVTLSDAMMAMVITVTSEEIRSEGDCDGFVQSEENGDRAHVIKRRCVPLKQWPACGCALPDAATTISPQK